jgi:uncharacterized protein
VRYVIVERMPHAHEMPFAVRAALVTLERRLRERFGADLVDVRLFGSYARGEAHDGSDVDVFVLLRTLTFAVRAAVLDLAADVSLETELRLSPVVFDVPRWELWRAQERALAVDIERDGLRP